MEIEALSEPFITLSDVSDISEKIAGGAPLNESETDRLIMTNDLSVLGMLAERERCRRHKNRVTFVRVVKFDMQADREQQQQTVAECAGEIRIVGTPQRLAEAQSCVSDVSAIARGVPVSGFSLKDIVELSVNEKVSLQVALSDLRSAGLDLLSEASIDSSVSLEKSVEEVGVAGLGVARFTVDDITPSDLRVVIRRVVSLQRATGLVRTFAPLSRRRQASVPSTGYDDVKQVALARLLSDNIESIQVDWELYGPKLAQVTLLFGADDIDGVSTSDREDLGLRRSSLEELKQNVYAASLVPVERNGRFEIKEP